MQQERKCLFGCDQPDLVPHVRYVPFLALSGLRPISWCCRAIGVDSDSFRVDYSATAFGLRNFGPLGNQELMQTQS